MTSSDKRQQPASTNIRTICPTRASSSAGSHRKRQEGFDAGSARPGLNTGDAAKRLSGASLPPCAAIWRGSTIAKLTMPRK